jgi:mRNA-degrading endonuclease RelE of RelBE toxin-antitoxin system
MPIILDQEGKVCFYFESFEKVKKKDPVLLEYLKKKLDEIAEDPERFKPLRYDLKGFRAIHFGSFVLRIHIKGDIVTIVTLDHHDQAY